VSKKEFYLLKLRLIGLAISASHENRFTPLTVKAYYNGNHPTLRALISEE
jgi:hypothetical protein